MVFEMGELVQTELGTITPDWKSRETEIGLIPESWDVVPLGDVLTMAQYGLSLKGEKSGHYGLLRMTNQVDGKISTCNLQYVSISESDFSKYSVERGDLLFNRTNSFELVGRSAIFDIVGDYVFASYLIRLRTNAERIDPYFLNYYLSADETQARLKSIATRSVSQSNISASRLRGFPVPLPSISEQKKIAYVLSAVQRAIEQQHRIISLTTELKKALLHKLFTEGLRGEAQKETEIGPVPKSWEILPLEKVASIERGKFSHRPRNAPQFYGGSIPFVQTGDVSNSEGRIETYTQTLNEEGLRISKVFPTGTILITIAANIGFSGILQFDSACPDSLIGLTPNERISTGFLQHYLSTQQPVMDRLAPRGTQKNINIQFLKPWPVLIPSQDEQSQIEHILNITDMKRRLAMKRKVALGDLFRNLIHQLMTAQIRVNDLDIGELETDIME